MSVACCQEHKNLGFWEGSIWEKVGRVKLGNAEDPKCQGMDAIWLPVALLEVTVIQFQDLSP